MKIALVIDYFYPRKGGAEKSLDEILHALQARGHELHIVAMRWDEALPRFFKTHRVNAPSFPRWRKDLGFVKNSSAQLKQIAPDLVLGVRHTLDVDVFLARGGFYCETLKANLEAKPSIFRALAQRFSPKQRVLLSLERKLFTRPKPPLVITPSHLIKQHCLRNFSIPDHRVVVIPNGVDLQIFHPANPETRARLRVKFGFSHEIVLVFAAHNFRLKGLDCLLRAWRAVDPAAFRLLVVGRDKRPPAASQFSNVQFLGDYTNTVELFQAADALVHPTFYDTFARVVIEALACGLPVITTKLAGASELMTDGKEGFLLDDPRDTDLLSKKISTLKSGVLRTQFSVSARALAEQFPQSSSLAKTVAAIEAEGAK